MEVSILKLKLRLPYFLEWQDLQSEISIVAIMSGFQPEDKGSTPLFRSEGLFGFIGEVVITLACHARDTGSIPVKTVGFGP